MTVFSRSARDIRRVAGLRRPSSATSATFTRGVLRGLVIAGLAGAAWCLGSASAHAAVYDDAAGHAGPVSYGDGSSFDLAPLTAAAFGGVTEASEQAARPTQANQLEAATTPVLDAVPVEGAVGTLVLGLNETATDTVGIIHGESGGASRTGSADTVGHEDHSTASLDATSATSPDGDDPSLSLVEDTVRPLALDDVITAPAAPLNPFLGLVRPVSEPLASVARPVVAPLYQRTLAETVRPMTGAVDTITQPVVGVLSEVTAPVADVVTPMSATLAQVAPIVPVLSGSDLGTFVMRPDGTYIGPVRAVTGVSGVTPAQALLKATGHSAETRSGAEQSSSESTDAATAIGAGWGEKPAGTDPMPLPARPDLGYATGGATSGSGAGGATGYVGGSTTAHQYLPGEDAQVSRVRPATATMGRPAELVADPAVSPD